MAVDTCGVQFRSPPLLGTPVPNGFEEGDIVRHDTFGEGQVCTVNSEPGRVSGDIVTVEFGGNLGRKRLLVKYAPIRMVRAFRDRQENHA